MLGACTSSSCNWCRGARPLLNMPLVLAKLDNVLFQPDIAVQGIIQKVCTEVAVCTLQSYCLGEWGGTHVKIACAHMLVAVFMFSSTLPTITIAWGEVYKFMGLRVAEGRGTIYTEMSSSCLHTFFVLISLLQGAFLGMLPAWLTYNNYSWWLRILKLP